MLSYHYPDGGQVIGESKFNLISNLYTMLTDNRLTIGMWASLSSESHFHDNRDSSESRQSLESLVMSQNSVIIYQFQKSTIFRRQLISLLVSKYKCNSQVFVKCTIIQFELGTEEPMLNGKCYNLKR